MQKKQYLTQLNKTISLCLGRIVKMYAGRVACCPLVSHGE